MNVRSENFFTTECTLINSTRVGEMWPLQFSVELVSFYSFLTISLEYSGASPPENSSVLIFFLFITTNTSVTALSKVCGRFIKNAVNRTIHFYCITQPGIESVRAWSHYRTTVTFLLILNQRTRQEKKSTDPNANSG